jgi:hypothetical protein|tara:strand:+ start:464 stop:589 length:126 start_codon:yes stop_codon:yes gene_type:complete
MIVVPWHILLAPFQILVRLAMLEVVVECTVYKSAVKDFGKI